MADKTVIIMRGLPWTGKSTRAKELAGEEGLIFCTDDYFYTEVEPDKPEEYSWAAKYLPQAHKWNLLRFQDAVHWEKPLLIVDNTNVVPSEPKAYVEYAHINGYDIRIEEPTSPQWLELKPLLYNKKANRQALKEWSEKLAEGSKETHGVPPWVIERRMWKWCNDMTVEQILNAPDFR